MFFEHYFEGEVKDENVNYQFNTLKDVKWYIKNFKHLPGITPAWALNKSEDGAYEFNLSGLSVQTLEKVEELFLYAIEQEEKIETLEEELQALKTEQKEELDTLKNENKSLNERMERLEALLLKSSSEE